MSQELKTNHIFEFDVNNINLTIEDKAYAGCFRKFWDYFMKYDLNKTIRMIDKAGIRTSDSEYFVSINGSKKKNIPLVEGRWIYTHLNPEAMKRAYDKFITEWEKELEITASEKDIEKAEENTGLKNIYKKSLAMELVRRGHDLEHTMRNRNNPKYQVFVFKDTPEFIRDLLDLTNK